MTAAVIPTVITDTLRSHGLTANPRLNSDLARVANDWAGVMGVASRPWVFLSAAEPCDHGCVVGPSRRH